MKFERPTVKALVEFKGADVFGEEGAESFTCSEAIECLEQALDITFDPDGMRMNVQDWLEDAAPFMTIGAYKRMQLTPAWIKNQAKSLTENLRENFSEEHGDEDGDDRLTDEHAKELMHKMHEVVTWYAVHARVWNCEELKKFRLDKDDILEVVQQLRPEWLKEPKEP